MPEMLLSMLLYIFDVYVMCILPLFWMHLDIILKRIAATLKKPKQQHQIVHVKQDTRIHDIVGGKSPLCFSVHLRPAQIDLRFKSLTFERFPTGGFSVGYVLRAAPPSCPFITHLPGTFVSPAQPFRCGATVTYLSH